MLCSVSVSPTSSFQKQIINIQAVAQDKELE